MGCNQSKAATTKPSEPVELKPPQQQQSAVAEVAAIAAAVTIAPPAAPEVEKAAEASPASAAVEVTETQPAVVEPVVVAPAPEVEAVVADVPATPAVVAPIVAATPMTPVKKTAKKHHKKQQQQQQAPVAEAFSRTAPVAHVAEQENSAVSPKRSALKSSATPVAAGRASTGFGLSAKVNGNVTSPIRMCDGDADKKAVHFAAEPAKQQHQDKVTQIVNKLKGKGARNGLNKSNVREDVLQAQISAFERLLTDASTLTRQMDSR